MKNFLYRLVFLWSVAGIISSHENDGGHFQKFPHEDNPITGNSLFSHSELKHLEELLQNIPQEQLNAFQAMASKTMNKFTNNENHINPNENVESPLDISSTDEMENAVLTAMREGGLLDSWKQQLEQFIFDDDVKFETNDQAKEFVSNLKCAHKDHKEDSVIGSDPAASAPPVNSIEDVENAVHQMLGNSNPPAAGSSAEDVQSHDTAEPAAYKEAPKAMSNEDDSSKLTDEKPRVIRVQENKERVAAEPKKNPNPTREEGKSQKGGKKSKSKKKGNHLNGLLNVAKQFLGQDDTDPTLDIIVNMASAYMKSGSQKSGNDDGLGSLLQLASLFGGDKSGGNILELFGSFLGDSDFNFNNILQLGSNLLADPGKKGSFSDVIIAYLANYLDMDPQLLSNYFNAFNSMVQANSWTDINTILRQNIGTSAEDLLNLIENDDIREGMAENLISTVVTGIHNFADPANLNMRILFVNAFLVQNKYPIIDPKNIIETASIVLDRLVKDYLGYQIDTKTFFKTAESNLKFLLRIDMNDNFDIRNYTKEELINSAKHSVKTEVFDTIAKLWSDFKLASENPQCARTIICLSNLPLTVRSPLGLKAAVTRGASTVMAWALSKTDEKSMPPFNSLYQAAWDGTLDVDCMLKFSENCRTILKGPKPLMQLDFEHHEL